VKTVIIPIDPQHIDPAALDHAAAIIRRGGLVAFPTETVYALGADVFNTAAVDAVFNAKGRPGTDPLIVHIHQAEQLHQVVRELPPLAEQLAAAFWPGPLTLVLPRREDVPPAVSAGKDTVAVRLPAHPVICGLIERAGVPVVGPSANRFGHTSPTTAQHVLDDLDGRIDAVIDSGPTRIGVESTVLDVSGDVPRLLRPGGVSLEQLRQFIPNLAFEPVYQNEITAASGPGMLLSHYAPRARLLLYDGHPDQVHAAILRAVHEQVAGGKQPGVLGILVNSNDAQEYEAASAIVAVAGKTLEAAAAGLFRAMRDLDSAGVQVMFANLPPAKGLGLALRDRLIRAASGQIVQVD
jgi:L-threonylcarbamoyladenylate synthase